MTDQLQVGDRVRTIPEFDDEQSVTGTVAGWFIHPHTNKRWLVFSAPFHNAPYPPERLERVSA